MEREPLTKIILEHPDRGAIPVECALAICFVESSFREWAIKYESHYKWIYGDPAKLSIGEILGQKHSWGIMQVMGATARELGLTGPFTDLWDPRIGLSYGMRYLRRLYARHKNWPDTIAAYNAGSPRKIDGKYENQSYVDAVLRYWNEFEHKVPLKESET